MRADPFHVAAHQQSNRDREADRHDSPWTRLERVHYHQREDSNQYDHDAENGDKRRVTRNGADFVLRHLAECFSVATERRTKDDKILNGAAKSDADDYP